MHVSVFIKIQADRFTNKGKIRITKQVWVRQGTNGVQWAKAKTENDEISKVKNQNNKMKSNKTALQ